jgi:C-terminal processing protease CtpA/Prc
MYTRPHVFTIGLLLSGMVFALPSPVYAGEQAQPERSEQQALLAEAEQARIEAQQAREEAGKAARRARELARGQAALAREEAAEAREASGEQRRQQTEEQARHQEEMERVREELSRAHRELREASREIAQAHRALADHPADIQMIRHLNLGDRAVLGVVLGRETDTGVEIIGVSPDGPAERAGLQAGDVLVSIRGEDLAAASGSKGRETLFRVMDQVEDGETLPVVISRNGESLSLEVTAERREPSSWQTMIRIPEAPLAPDAPSAAAIHVEGIEIPHIDHQALEAHIEALTEELKAKEFRFVTEDGKGLEISEEFVLPEGFEVEIAELSELAGQALREANVWFGLPYAQGLELAEVNEGLGTYFETDRGVLVLKARPENAYRLEAGDVVLDVDGHPVNSPADLIRALREIEPGSEIEFAIKRDRRDETLSVVMPENRLGFHGFRHPPSAEKM